jgi:hypothetical protein
LWLDPKDGPLHRQAKDYWQAHVSQAEGNQSRANRAPARVEREHGEVAAVSGAGVFPIPRDSNSARLDAFRKEVLRIVASTASAAKSA